MSTPDPTPTPLPAAPTPEAAAAMGAQGGPPSEAERLAFEAWMRGHSWPVAGVWNGTTYTGRPDLELPWLDTAAMSTRMLWAAWRDRAALATPPAATREAVPLPQAPTDEDLDDLCAEFSFLTDDDESRDSLIEMFRAVLARWGGAAVSVPVSEQPWERDGWCDAEGRCWFGAERDNGIDSVWVLRRPAERISYQRWCVPHWALPVPAADKGEASR